MKRDVLVVGGGLFGMVIAKELTRLGREVDVFDDQRPLNGTAPSGMLTKPSWISGMGKEVHEPALEVLERNFTVTRPQFQLGPKKLGGVLCVDSEQVRNAVPVLAASVTQVNEDGSVQTTLGERKYLLVIVAAGVWSNQLVAVPGLVGKQGISFTWDVTEETQLTGFIKPWAPYKQIVGFKQTPTKVWCGDGSAIMTDNWSEEREAQCLRRCANALPKAYTQAKAKRIVGIRPYVTGSKPCYLKQVSKNLWVATGGAKNGIIAAGYCAHVLGSA